MEDRRSLQIVLRVILMQCQQNTKQLIWLTKHLTGAARRAETGCRQQQQLRLRIASEETGSGLRLTNLT